VTANGEVKQTHVLIGGAADGLSVTFHIEEPIAHIRVPVNFGSFKAICYTMHADGKYRYNQEKTEREERRNP